jgi:hypothetical protein
MEEKEEEEEEEEEEQRTCLLGQITPFKPNS